MSNLYRQDTCPAYVLECNGVTMAFLNVGHGCDRTYNPQGLKRPSFHLCSHRLLYQGVEAASYASVMKAVVACFIEIWSPNWEGPYVMKKAFSRGAWILTEMDGGEFSSLVNAAIIKKYYA